MSADDRLDSLAESVSDGRPVDWVREETSADADEEARVRALRDLSLIAEFSRDLQRGFIDTPDETASDQEQADDVRDIPDDNE